MCYFYACELPGARCQIHYRIHRVLYYIYIVDMDRLTEPVSGNRITGTFWPKPVITGNRLLGTGYQPVIVNRLQPVITGDNR